MRKIIRKWLGIEQNEIQIDAQMKKISNLTRKHNNSVSDISGNQSKIDTINKKLSKH